MKDIIAIIGPTASGKSDYAINLAKKSNAIILSVDSLSVYKEIDIASAKPNKKELEEIKHFGIDILYPNEKFDVIKFLDEFKKAKDYTKKTKKELIIVGGTSFYIKVLKEGISPMPKIDNHIKQKVQNIIKDLDYAYQELKKIDSIYASKISTSDRYRIQKAYEIYLSTNLAPSKYFEQNPPSPIEPNLKIYEIIIDRVTLRDRITKRTQKMLNMGLIDEISYLESKYTREPNSMKAIGIKEVLDYFDGKLPKDSLKEKIIINTMNLAKRQVTFNKTQLKIDKHIKLY